MTNDAIRGSSDRGMLVLTSLAGPKHGYALIKDIEGFAGVTLGLARFPARWRSWRLPAWSRPCRQRSAATPTASLLTGSGSSANGSPSPSG